MRFSLLNLAVVIAALVASTGSAEACGVCQGQSDGSQIGGALNGAIFVMLGFLGTMLAGITGVAYSIWRRSQNPLPAHLELAELIGSQPTSK
jgi:hypothetical protein